jgi:hypothetical protein
LTASERFVGGLGFLEFPDPEAGVVVGLGIRGLALGDLEVLLLEV